MARNIHQRRIKSTKASATKPVIHHVDEQVYAPVETVATPLPAKRVAVAGKGGISQEVMDARVAELPWELKRIALFSAGVVILLIVLWFALR